MSKEDSSGEGKFQDASTSDTPTKDPNAEIYENRGHKKIIRVVTVMAYLFSVSFVGILLSAYYIFLWEPPNPRLMQRERLQADPQMQFLIAPHSEETELTKKDSSFLLQNEPNVQKPLLGRMIQDTHNGDDPVDFQDKVNLEKKRRLNMVLLNLKHSLVDTLRARNQNLSREIAISSRFNNVGMEKVLNSTIDANTRLGKKTYRDNTNLSLEFANSVNMLNVESTSSTSNFTIIPETETSQIYSERDSVTKINPIIEENNHKKKSDTVVRGFNNARINSNSFKTIRKFLKTDKRKSTKENRTDNRWLVNNNRKNPDDVQTNVTSKERVNSNIRNPRKNYSSESSEDQIGQITRDIVSIDPLSLNLGFTDDPRFHQTSNDLTFIKLRPRITGTRNSKGERIRANLPVFMALG